VPHAPHDSGRPAGAGAGRAAHGARRPDVATTFLRWTALRAACHRGYVVSSGLYFVLVAHLDGAQLIALGGVFAVTLALADVPAGAWADAVSRRRSLIAGHASLASGMVLTGLVTSFPALLASQALWGLGWAFSGGADVAWLTDELARPERIAAVLVARARWELLGGAAGMVGFGVLGWAGGLAPAIVLAGLGMAALGGLVGLRFGEHRAAGRVPRRGASRRALRGGLALARRDPELRRMFAATLVLNAAGMVAWLFPRRLVDLGFPGDPRLWYAAFGVAGAAAGVAALRAVGGRIAAREGPRRAYAAGCAAGVLGLLVLAAAPSALAGGAGMLLATGVAFTVTRAVSVIWVNRRSTSDVRATVLSLLSQSETLGEIGGGFGLAALARGAGTVATLVAAAALVACAGAIGARARADRAAP
jgi:MFS transporter, DHA3 family, tetracycline resistance protein